MTDIVITIKLNSITLLIYVDTYIGYDYIIVMLQFANRCQGVCTCSTASTVEKGNTIQISDTRLEKQNLFYDIVPFIMALL